MNAGQEKQEVKADGFVRCLNDPFASVNRLLSTFSKDHHAQFLLCNASTKVSDHEGISAAGADSMARRWTPALDAEALLTGRTISLTDLPVSPKGIVSPVVITSACLDLLKMERQIIDCGSFYSPATTHIRLSQLVAECPSSGVAMPDEHVQSLFNDALKLGKEFAQTKSHLVIAECVPGGTTTALALLIALGYSAGGLVSSSLPNCNHTQRMKIVETGFSNLRHDHTKMKENPLLAVAALGDPMQAVAAGLAIGASESIPVFLAGGSQMIAVWALIKALRTDSASSGASENILVMSTKWIANDLTAGVNSLAQMTLSPFVVAHPDFYRSKHNGLRAYEDGNVKEGVGAGAAMCLAHLAGFSDEIIISAIDKCYAAHL